MEVHHHGHAENPERIWHQPGVPEWNKARITSGGRKLKQSGKELISLPEEEYRLK